MKDMGGKFEEFKRLIEKWSVCGERTTESGARLICPTPHVAPKAYLHAIFRGLNPDEISELEKQLGRSLPEEFKGFLSGTNGALLFSYTINIYGFRGMAHRQGDQAWQPFSLVDENWSRPKGSPVDAVYFAGLPSALPKPCRIYFGNKLNSGFYEVGMTPRDTFSPLQVWPSFWDWLLDETKNLAQVFDDKGKKKPA